jgi:hypothetical protein
MVIVLSCTGTDPSSPSRSGPASPVPHPFVRTCESSVYGDLGPGWRRDNLHAGPVFFVGANGYADEPVRWFEAPGKRPTLQKVLVVVAGDRPVEVRVSHRDAALAYDPDVWGLRNRMPFGLGDPVVRFEPCGGDQWSTQFNGGFLIRGPMCVPVEIRVDGDAPSYATLSFGSGDCG